MKRRWPGSATAGQLRELLTDGERAVRSGGTSILAQADAAALAKDWQQAATLYAQAGDRPEILLSRMEALMRGGAFETCARLAREAMDKTGDTQTAIDFVSVATECAKERHDTALLARAEQRLTGLLADKNAPIAVDDRGAAYQMLWELRASAGDKPGAEEAAKELLSELGEAAAKAPDAYAASTFNWARASAYLYLKQGPEALKMLEASEKALPDDYNPPAHQARVYRELDRPDDGLAALARALPKAYGPRKGGLLGLKGELYERKGDLPSAAEAYQAQVSLYEALPPEQLPPGRLQTAQANAARCKQGAQAAR